MSSLVGPCSVPKQVSQRKVSMRALMMIPFILLDSVFATLTETQEPLSIKQELVFKGSTCSVAQRAANLYLWDGLHTQRDLL